MLVRPTRTSPVLWRSGREDEVEQVVVRLQLSPVEYFWWVFLPLFIKTFLK